MSDRPYFTVNCPHCGRDIKEHILELAEYIRVEFGCSKCLYSLDEFEYNEHCKTCNMFHKNFKRIE